MRELNDRALLPRRLADRRRDLADHAAGDPGTGFADRVALDESGFVSTVLCGGDLDDERRRAGHRDRGSSESRRRLASDRIAVCAAELVATIFGWRLDHARPDSATVDTSGSASIRARVATASARSLASTLLIAADEVIE